MAIIKPFMAARRFASTIGAGTGTGAASEIGSLLWLQPFFYKNMVACIQFGDKTEERAYHEPNVQLYGTASMIYTNQDELTRYGNRGILNPIPCLI
ncbi:hypothetical protein M3650_11760 [Paenibacillus sp. MER TA 81-3]|uniref:hypothetical protein n=1 Tax=Paenibacillus sp. MER TA 81-3 TaxID=2939573 RepID=UPI00203D0827|nr:hypothetical protein [Paenibacillus sp. MER TA 81-3]MCM3339293.1 hypothetical protein [Paenibacillus sp. MER TA 81-3]